MPTILYGYDIYVSTADSCCSVPVFVENPVVNIRLVGAPDHVLMDIVTLPVRIRYLRGGYPALRFPQRVIWRATNLHLNGKGWEGHPNGL